LCVALLQTLKYIIIARNFTSHSHHQPLWQSESSLVLHSPRITPTDYFLKFQIKKSAKNRSLLKDCFCCTTRKWYDNQSQFSAM